MTEAESKAFWTGFAASNTDNIIINSVLGEARIATADFDANYTAHFILADGGWKDIVGCDLVDGKITGVWVKGSTISVPQLIECEYDDDGYLIQVGATVVAGIEDLELAGGAAVDVEALAFTSDTAYTATYHSGNADFVATKDAEGRIATATLDGREVPIQRDSTGLLLSVNGVDVSGLSNLSLPTDGNSRRF